MNFGIAKFGFFCFLSERKKENATSKSRINTWFYNKNTIESELMGEISLVASTFILTFLKQYGILYLQ